MTTLLRVPSSGNIGASTQNLRATGFGGGPEDSSREVSTLLYRRLRNAWAPDLIQDVLRRSELDQHVSVWTVRTCVQWILSLPAGVPKPFFAIGDDGSLGLEWERVGNYLYLLFTETGSEAYFEGSNGDQWESSLEAALDKLADALRTIARS